MRVTRMLPNVPEHQNVDLRWRASACNTAWTWHFPFTPAHIRPSEVPVVTQCLGSSAWLRALDSGWISCGQTLAQWPDTRSVAIHPLSGQTTAQWPDTRSVARDDRERISSLGVNACQSHSVQLEAQTHFRICNSCAWMDAAAPACSGARK